MTLLNRWLALAAAGLLLATTAARAAPLVLTTKSFTEQHILSAMTVLYLQRKAFRWSRAPISRR